MNDRCSCGHTRADCPIWRAIDAGLPGMPKADDREVEEARARFEKRTRKVSRAELFRTFRASGCNLLKTAYALGFDAYGLAQQLDEGTRRSLRKIKRASVEVDD